MSKQLRYIRIVETLRTQILEGRFPPGSLLPSHKELAELFSTSLMTARQAVAVLAEEGLLSIIHGRGTFVSSREVGGAPISLQGFQNDMDRQHNRIETRVLSKEYGIVSASLSRLFNKKTAFACLTRLRLLKGKPIILQKSFIAEDYKKVIEKYEANLSLYQTFSEGIGILITRGQEIMSPVIIRGDILERLGMEKPVPAFRSRRLSLTLEGRAVIFDEAYLPGPVCYLASSKQGRSNKFKYIINPDGKGDTFSRFLEPSLWEDLL